MMQKTEVHADGALLRIVPTIRPSAGGNTRVVRIDAWRDTHGHGCAVGVDVRKYVPEMLDYGTPITIRHLLTHTSGLRDQWNLIALARGLFEVRITEADVMDTCPRQTALNSLPAPRMCAPIAGSRDGSFHADATDGRVRHLKFVKRYATRAFAGRSCRWYGHRTAL